MIVGLISILLFCTNVHAENTVNTNNALSQLFAELKIEQGVANFTQKKYFAFLSTPITSQGILKINKGNVIWQVEKPIFSKLMILKDEIWQLSSEKNESPAHYQKVVSHASIESLIRAIFTGDVNSSQWKIALINPRCLALTPNDGLLSQAITDLEICLAEDKKQRQVTIKDAQNNRTEIEINMTAFRLLDTELHEFNLKK